MDECVTRIMQFKSEEALERYQKGISRDDES